MMHGAASSGRAPNGSAIMKTWDELVKEVEAFGKLSEEEQRKAINELARTTTLKAREAGFLGEDESLFGIAEPKKPDDSATQS